ncbi:sugar ABC transporter substrate-binding protein [Streptomyces sp. M2CJ-2]|uniref:sugar ABC transporter substrate-binding protein n=1 Tax=Streptomyces sp. M2CJ-2 TaxID=2803948 RepID=UPI001923EC77|nr:sugar ABC transporter substrate-binding protein [Streptomyces sp. M2CJ-2]MBL3666639.1 sugar ABC transporter substrate-binding protein [Streptomyces sp. M2CJ-2]
MEVWIRQDAGSPSAESAEALTKAFTQETGVKAKLVAVGVTDFETKLQQRTAQKDLPDIVINDTGQLGNLVTQGLVREVDRGSVAGGADLADRAWEAAQGHDGKYYGVPFNSQAFALLIRKDWREKVGADVPESWDELTELAVKFTKEDPDGNGKDDTAGMVIPGTTTRGYLTWWFSTMLWSEGGDFVKEQGDGYTPAIDEPASVKAVEKLQAMFCDSKVAQPGASTADSSTTHTVFESGKGGIYLTGPYMLPRFDGSLGKDKYEVVAPPPGAGGETVLAEGENVYLMAGSANEKGQQKFAEFAASPAGQKIGLGVDNGGIIVRLPVNTEVDGAAERKDPRWETFQQVYNESGRNAPALPNWSTIRQISAEGLNGVVSDCARDVTKAMGDLAGEFAAELEKQGAKG